MEQWPGRARAWPGFAVVVDQSDVRNVTRIFLVLKHANITLTP